MHLAIGLLLALLCATCQANGHASSTNNVMKLCGQDFSNMYEYCCKNGFRSGKRQIIFSEDYPESGEKAFGLIRKRKALSFLKSRRHLYGRDLQRLKRSFATDNAYEECCIEGCTIEEVREYPCY